MDNMAKGLDEAAKALGYQTLRVNVLEKEVEKLKMQLRNCEEENYRMREELFAEDLGTVNSKGTIG